MKKFNTSPISGMQELLPSMQSQFNYLKDGIIHAFSVHGFQSIETPIIERTDVLLAKAGGDTEKQIYKIVKTSEDASQADQALRFDHTVPLARYVVEHMNDLAFPFKVSQVNRNFRGERPQKGRFREFYQCDVDVIGWQQLPLAYDAEVIRTLMDALEVLPIQRYRVRISNRKILSGLLEELQLSEKSSEIFNIIDHAEKVSATVTHQALADLQISSENIEKITNFMSIQDEPKLAIQKLRNLNIHNETFRTGVDELDEVLRHLSGRADDRFQIVADMLIVRGLDYYTGTVFETIAPEHQEFGSVCSGGRYENLAQYYTDQALPGVGGSIGLTRLFSAMRDADLISDKAKSFPVDVCIIPFSAAEFTFTENLAKDLRRDGQEVDIIFTDKKLGDKIKYASKISQYMIIIGEDEVRNKKYKLKNLETSEQEEITLS